MRALTFAAACLCAGVIPSHAAQFAQHGSIAILAGNIQKGDADAFRAFMARPEAREIRQLHLTSGGGNIREAREIGRMVREAKLTTVVDAARAVCYSACTGIFAAGRNRHYMNAQAIIDGISLMKVDGGLGFHEGSVITDQGRQSWAGASDAMAEFYREMGVPNAVHLINRADFDKIHRISSTTALANGIATSLSAP
ncbi:MAG: hypothetical protein ACRCTD_03860 [Beijerinckiaceae bacterium]